MVRFSQTLGDKQLKNKQKPYEQVMENPNYYSQEKQPYVIPSIQTVSRGLLSLTQRRITSGVA